MSSHDPKDALARSIVGALIGVLVGLLLVVGTASYYANSNAVRGAVIVTSVLVCSAIAWRYGDRFTQSVHRWIQWFL